MAGLPPTPGFANVDLVIAPVDVGKTFGRIHRKAFPEPLGYGKNATRFSDPRGGPVCLHSLARSPNGVPAGFMSLRKAVG